MQAINDGADFRLHDDHGISLPSLCVCVCVCVYVCVCVCVCVYWGVWLVVILFCTTLFLVLQSSRGKES